MTFDYKGFFYKATDTFGTYEKHINAPYIRKSFEAYDVKSAVLYVSGLGFYDIFVNGQKITKGLLAPYISNPDDYVYFDKYDVTDILKNGKNALGLILGNGMQNAHGGRVWDFDIARFRNAPCFALELQITTANGDEIVLTADDSFKCAPSPIIFDDLRSGCFYDANLEIKDWCLPEFDDSDWCFVKKAETPRGIFEVCDADPIVVTDEIKPVDVKECILSTNFDNRENMRLDTQFKFNKRGEKGILYDFGVNSAGIVRLKISGKKGQEIFIQFCEHILSNGEIYYGNTGSFYPDGYGQSIYYICNGEKDEIFVPSFTYFGFRYAVVFGLEKEQIIPETLTMLVANSDIKQIGDFTCSDETMTKLGKMGTVSDLANFYYFPTDCPHREKNGWTGDAAVSAEHILLTRKAEKSYREWLKNICAAQSQSGCLPGIVPTAGWGFQWGNGPAWDNVLTELCWQIYRFRGDLTPAKECSENMLRYLSYISQKRREDGLIAIGLGDWLQPMKGAGDPTAPLYLTDSVISMYICNKSYELFKALGLTFQADFAKKLSAEFKQAIRKNCINFNTMTVLPRCQTAQSICIFYGVFDECEKQAAGKVLVDIIHEKGDHFDCGMIGVRTVFHVLSDLGEGALAYKLITQESYPSYGSMIKQGLTSLPEDFIPESQWDTPNSLNHHFMGDIKSWFIQRVVGLRVNPQNNNPNYFDISPDFSIDIKNAGSYYEAPCGKVTVNWSSNNGIYYNLEIVCPDSATGFITLPNGFVFLDEKHPDWSTHGSSRIVLKSGTYQIKKA